jgi:hypothetical protein
MLRFFLGTTRLAREMPNIGIASRIDLRNLAEAKLLQFGNQGQLRWRVAHFPESRKVNDKMVE